MFASRCAGEPASMQSPAKFSVPASSRSARKMCSTIFSDEAGRQGYEPARIQPSSGRCIFAAWPRTFAMNPELVENLSRAGRKHKLFEPTEADALDLSRSDIERLVPHRDPFLFVDRITAVNLSNATIAGQRRIDPFDPLFQGHFPGDPIYPGVLQVETMGQLGLCLFRLLKNERATVHSNDRPPVIRGVKIHHAVFLAPIRPGDRLVILAKVLESDEYTGICSGQLLNGSEVCSFAITEAYFVED